MTPDDFPIGSTVTTTVYTIGNRSEEVTGTVTEHVHNRKGRFVFVNVATEAHGTLSVEVAKARREL